VIAFPRATVPVPDAVADLAGRQLPPHVRDAVGRQAATLRRYAQLAQPQYAEARWILAQDIATANKTLAAHNPGLVARWGNLPGLRKEER
jgi:hypothetical protein